MKRRDWLVTALGWPVLPAHAQALDPGHAAWTALLKRHVVLASDARASQVRYAGMAGDRGALKAYLGALAAVTPQAFEAMGKPDQMAFLINAYNAATVELILTQYPRLRSIKDLGSLLRTPWTQKFVSLLGTTMSLDQIEHETLRARGRYDDPRIHFAVNCASVGCPMLREEAFVGDRLDSQLDEQMRRFLGDRSRNRWNADRRQLEVSKIFDWYGTDFSRGHKGIASLPALFARHADLLADAPADRERIRTQRFELAWLDYDWQLNDAR